MPRGVGLGLVFFAGFAGSLVGFVFVVILARIVSPVFGGSKAPFAKSHQSLAVSLDPDELLFHEALRQWHDKRDFADYDRFVNLPAIDPRFVEFAKLLSSAGPDQPELVVRRWMAQISGLVATGAMTEANGFLHEALGYEALSSSEGALNSLRLALQRLSPTEALRAIALNATSNCLSSAEAMEGIGAGSA